MSIENKLQNVLLENQELKQKMAIVKDKTTELQQEIDQLKDQQKKGELTLLKVILDAVEEILNKNNETTGDPKGGVV